MNKCDCYCVEEHWYMKPDPWRWAVSDVAKCNGTKERDVCSCGGDPAKCDFYPEVREKAKIASGTPIDYDTFYNWCLNFVNDEYIPGLDTLFNNFYLIPKEKNNGQ